MMAAIHAFATLQSASPAGRLAHDCRNLPDTLVETFHCLSAAPSVDNSSQPPRKKRRLEDDVEATTYKARSRDSANSVVLASIDVEIHLATEDEISSKSLPADHADILEKYDVVITNVKETSTDHLRITVCANDDRSSSFDLAIRTTSQRLASDLKYVELTTPRAKGSRKAKLTRVVWSSCSLGLHRKASNIQLQLQAKIHWIPGVSAAEMKLQTAEDILNKYMPDGQGGPREPWSPQDFYGSVHVPPLDMKTPAALQNDTLQSQLFPFQRRAVSWLLRREQVSIAEDGKVTAVNGAGSADTELPPSFCATKDAEGRQCYVSHLRGMIVDAIGPVQDAETHVRGGILAEEMGLGKTVEMISLITLHKREMQSASSAFDIYTGSEVVPSRATLIITPPSILQQWMSELSSHAPSLKVYHYKGLKDLKADDNTLLNTLLDQDVVLTTYNVLSREIHYAKPAPERSLRTPKRDAPRKSPLVQISWWRVCLDEAQMVENGVSNAATVARLIPRVNAWAVSGTPLRRDVKDLLGLLMFLRYEPYCSSSLLWQRLVTRYKDCFREVFHKLALRHTKEQVRQDLRIPPQKRIVITIPFTAVEEQHYAHMFQQMCDDCGLSTDGAPLQDDWNPDAAVTVEKMRNWLSRLRQTCLHPEVGGRNRRALGRENGPLRTVSEVLEVMIEQNDNALRTEERAMLMAQIAKGQTLEFGRQPKNALNIFLEVLDRSRALVEEARQDIDTELTLQQQQAENTSEQLNNVIPSESDGEEQDEREGKNPRVGILRNRLRTLLEVQHICTFFAANTIFQLREERSPDDVVTEDSERLEVQEHEFYERAKAIRKELLSDVHSKANKDIRRIAQAVDRKAFTRVPHIKLFDGYGGIENRKLTYKIHRLTELLNGQATQLIKWRQAVVERLLLPLVDEEEDEGLDTTGEEYESSTKKQEELYVYLDALRFIIADRHNVITGQGNELNKVETEHAFTLATNGEGHAPELCLDVMTARAKVLPDEDLGSVRAVLTEARSMVTALRWQEGGGRSRAIAELQIVEAQLSYLDRISQEQLKAVTGLQKELNLFRTTMNLRLEFYKQLQELSDAVAPLKEATDEEVDQRALGRQLEEERRLGAKIASLKTKQRFLLHLRTESGSQEGPLKLCVICQSNFEVGVLTVCGHQYCKDCIRAWWSEHRSCPLCKKRLSATDFHQITYKPQEIKAQEEPQPASPERSPTTSTVERGIYSDISVSTLNEIKAVDIEGSFGTKIDTIARHIIYLRSADPGSKSIVFSQYSSFLSLLSTALTHFRIGHTSISKPNGIVQFQNDPSKEVFLLHAKADSSGLNLVNATHVFLCEPLINPAIELQAIARVHRIGQKRPTTVYMYLVEGTVEEAIYDISVKRRMAHIRRDDTAKTSMSGTATPTQEMAIEAANSLELQQAQLTKLLAKGKSGGEMVEKEDLWSCLFSRPRVARSGVAVMAQLGMGTETDVEREVGRFLRAEAAEARRDEEGPGPQAEEVVIAR